MADTLFGNGVVLKVGITWDGSITKLFLNDVSVQTSSYTKTVPNWTGASIFDLGAYEYLNLGGYNSTDDIIDEFTVIGPGAPPPPSVTITAPANGATVSGTATVSANATSPVGMAAVQFLLDGGNLGSAVTGAGPSYSTSWDTTKTANGLHSISAVATDSSGLMTTSGSISVTVNNVSSPPVISGVGAGAITPTGATISWTTNTPSNSQVSYGTTTAYGSVNSNPALVTAHSIALSGLSPQTTYHYRVQSQDAQGLTAQSGDFTFTTVPTGGQQTLLQMHLDATEVSGVTNGSIVTPSLAPPGFTGTVVVASGGSVNFAPAQVGNGVYFLNCCATNTAYYRFNGAAIGNIFNINQGQISFYLKSRYSLANRPTGARVVFDVRDGDPNNHLFHFVTDVATVGSERYLLFRYRVGNTAIPATTYVDYFFYVDHDVADTLFGNGVALKVGITWDGSVTKLFLNDVNVQTSSYTKTVPNWTGASIFDLGAYEYLNLGGYNSTDDIIDEFTVIGPGV